MREVLSRMENPDTINENTDIFDNIQFNIFI